MFAHRAATTPDFLEIQQFPINAEELSFMAPNLSFPLDAQALADIAATRDAPTVLTQNGVIAGYAALYVRDGHRCIGNVIVAPSFRGKGAGRALIDVMSQIAKKQFDALDVHLSCTNRNTIGLLLYTKLGFTPYAIATREDLNGGRRALIHMRRDLSAL
ncbi:MAG: GNAT family N-acetyltransferase [Alphaproteobacteria bacterium]|nr:GNAT family N-acetyltransferase [Alphaproteobacteria bacterium]